jgi:hypothetical protein
MRPRVHLRGLLALIAVAAAALALVRSALRDIDAADARRLALDRVIADLATFYPGKARILRVDVRPPGSGTAGRLHTTPGADQHWYVEIKFALPGRRIGPKAGTGSYSYRRDGTYVFGGIGTEERIEGSRPIIRATPGPWTSS